MEIPVLHLTSHLNHLPCSHIVIHHLTCGGNFSQLPSTTTTKKKCFKVYRKRVFETISHHTIDCVCTTAAQTGSQPCLIGVFSKYKKKAQNSIYFLIVDYDRFCVLTFFWWSLEFLVIMCAILKEIFNYFKLKKKIN